MIPEHPSSVHGLPSALPIGCSFAAMRCPPQSACMPRAFIGWLCSPLLQARAVNDTTDEADDPVGCSRMGLSRLPRFIRSRRAESTAHMDGCHKESRAKRRTCQLVSGPNSRLAHRFECHPMEVCPLRSDSHRISRVSPLTEDWPDCQSIAAARATLQLWHNGNVSDGAALMVITISPLVHLRNRDYGPRLAQADPRHRLVAALFGITAPRRIAGLQRRSC